MRPRRSQAVGGLLAALALLVLALGGCGGDEEQTTTVAGGRCAEVEAPAPKQARFGGPGQVLEPGEKASAVVQTSCGSFTIALDTERSPKTTNSFAYLAGRGFYDGTTFHRIAPGFVIQGGDPKGDGSGGPGYSVSEPPSPRAEYLRGVVAMAKSGLEPPGTSGSQFFVVTAPADAGLPPDYAILGEVSSGMGVVERIDALGDPQTEQPLRPVVIDAIAIERG